MLQPIGNTNVIELRRRARTLRPILKTGRAGVTPAFIEQIRRALTDHGLIKVKIAAADRSECCDLSQRLADATEGFLVEQTGYVAVLYSPVADSRPAPGGPDAAKERSEE